VPNYWLSNFVSILTQVLAMAIFARAILSWIPAMPPDHPIARFLSDITEPVLMPFRRVIPMVGMMDLSPLVAMLVLNFAGQMLANSLRGAGF